MTIKVITKENWREPTLKECSWFIRKTNRNPVALIKCPLCNTEQYLGLHHLINKTESKIDVQPSVVCAKEGCDFHEFISLSYI